MVAKDEDVKAASEALRVNKGSGSGTDGWWGSDGNGGTPWLPGARRAWEAKSELRLGVEREEARPRPARVEEDDAELDDVLLEKGVGRRLRSDRGSVFVVEEKEEDRDCDGGGRLAEMVVVTVAVVGDSVVVVVVSDMASFWCGAGAQVAN